MKGVSVIICCYNSASRLPETIKHLANQKTDKILWELIVIDNNSTDNTIDVAANEWKKYSLKIPFYIFKETRQGLSYARSKGYIESEYNILIYCDDDNWLSENYIQYAYNLFCNSSNVFIAGGRGTPVFQTKKPFWFEKFQFFYAVGELLPESGIVNNNGYLPGAGIIIRRQLFQLLELLPFSHILSGRKGKNLTSGEDAELCMVALFLGYDLYYDKELTFQHFLPASRLTWTYCTKLVTRGIAASQIYFYLYDYCYKSLQKGVKPDYLYAYKRNLRKPLKEFILLSKKYGLKKMILLLTRGKEGSVEEIELKRRLNNFWHTLTHPVALKNDFFKINKLTEKIIMQTPGEVQV